MTSKSVVIEGEVSGRYLSLTWTPKRCGFFPTGTTVVAMSVCYGDNMTGMLIYWTLLTCTMIAV